MHSQKGNCNWNLCNYLVCKHNQQVGTIWLISLQKCIQNSWVNNLHKDVISFVISSRNRKVFHLANDNIHTRVQLRDVSIRIGKLDISSESWRILSQVGELIRHYILVFYFFINFSKKCIKPLKTLKIPRNIAWNLTIYDPTEVTWFTRIENEFSVLLIDIQFGRYQVSFTSSMQIVTIK